VGSALLTLALRLVAETQRRGEPAAWITEEGTSFFPPDAARGGVDLAALVVVRVRERRLLPRAAGVLLRSGAFGLVVLDLNPMPGLLAVSGLPLAVQSRLAALARKHRAAVVCLTEKPSEAPSLGSLVAVRLEARRLRREGGRFAVTARVLKDKEHAHLDHLDEHRFEACRAPAGLC
jgi:recombination protein RecA